MVIICMCVYADVEVCVLATVSNEYSREIFCRRVPQEQSACCSTHGRLAIHLLSQMFEMPLVL